MSDANDLSFEEENMSMSNRRHQHEKLNVVTVSRVRWSKGSHSMHETKWGYEMLCTSRPGPRTQRLIHIAAPAPCLQPYPKWNTKVFENVIHALRLDVQPNQLDRRSLRTRDGRKDRRCRSKGLPARTPLPIVPWGWAPVDWIENDRIDCFCGNIRMKWRR